MRYFLSYLCAFLFLASPAVATQSTTVSYDESAITLLSQAESLKAGEELLVGFRVKLADGWHTYTYDPGDAGIPFAVTWDLPEGFAASKTHWPPHQTFDEAGLTTYGFSDEVVFTQRITVPSTLPEHSTLTANVEYLVCKEICIPQTAQLTLKLDKGAGGASVHQEYLGQWHEKSQLASQWGDITPNPASADASSNAATAQNITPSISAEFTEAAQDDQALDNARAATQSPPAHSILMYILFAFIGGLILNLMPCVFPILSLKALAIVTHAKSGARVIREEALAYTFGVLTCFLILWGGIVLLQQTGAAIGWGFQFQSPGFVGLMAILLFAIGLNLSGVFEIPVLFGNLSTKLGLQQGNKGSYYTGLLAALVATPCTAPFMASAIGFALGQTALTSLLIFTALGLGLAFPFLLLSFVPALLKWLPKPGAWMETFKHLLAFPIYLSAVWLLYVLGTQGGMQAIIIVLVFTILLIFLLWIKSRCSLSSSLCSIANLLVILALLTLMTQALSAAKPAAFVASDKSEKAVAYSPTKLAALRAAGQPVFVDATASWCITCKVNYATSISNAQVQQAFKQQGIVYMVADWTNRDQQISDYLQSFGHRGVPLYVYYAPEKPGKLLPQILTPSLILQAITLSH